MSDLTIHCSSIPEFRKLLRKDIKALNRRIRRAMRQTARDAVWRIRDRTPKAFGELRSSIHAVGDTGPSDPIVAMTVVSAPHASAVEQGSRPHWVPLDALVRWVKLRGMQGLSRGGKLKTKFGLRADIGTTTERHARRVAAGLKRLEHGGALSTEAPTQIARAIQKKIAEHGIRPVWMVKNTLPEIERVLHVNIARALEGAVSIE